jgi:Arc/MetJ-type ribon-helix-helix transcriptional regulator
MKKNTKPSREKPISLMGIVEEAAKQLGARKQAPLVVLIGTDASAEDVGDALLAEGAEVFVLTQKPCGQDAFFRYPWTPENVFQNFELVDRIRDCLWDANQGLYRSSSDAISAALVKLNDIEIAVDGQVIQTLRELLPLLETIAADFEEAGFDTVAERASEIVREARELIREADEQDARLEGPGRLHSTSLN